jgi:threonine aldolase
LFGEAVVICNESLKKDFRYHIKQNGGMLAKGRLLGLQFETLFTDDLYFKIAAHANVQALRIKEAFAAKGFEFLMDSPTNQQFPIVTEEQAAILGKDFGYTFWKRIDSERVAIRFCTSWATKTENVDKLVDFINNVERQ